MSNYTITTNFGAKDSLPSGNAGKVIKGSEFTTEFTNIQTAIATKADTAGDTFTGVVNFSDDIAVNTNTLFVDVSAAKVGIGTTSPANTLTVGALEASTNDQDATLGIKCNANHRGIILQENDGAEQWEIGVGEAGALKFYDSGSATSTITFQDGTGNVGIGTDSPDRQLTIANPTDSADMSFISGNAGNALIYFADTDDDNIGAIGYNHEFNFMNFRTNDLERMRIDSSGNVLVGTTATPTDDNTTLGFGVTSSGEVRASVDNGNAAMFKRASSDGDIIELRKDSSPVGSIGTASGGITFASGSATTERMRIDSSGNVLVGRTSDDFAVEGLSLRNSPTTNTSLVSFTRDGSNVAAFNRLTNDGSFITFYKDGSSVGSIGVSGSRPYFSNGVNDGIKIADDYVAPCNQTGADKDASLDLGSSSARFKDLYRSGSTYSTSDRNKKQDIRDLTDAEARVATVAKGSLKAFRYIDSVEAEGNEANIHFGIIAQDLKAAFEAEGLNANDYQVFKTSTYTDDDGVEQTTYSVCYENLLAFIIAAI